MRQFRNQYRALRLDVMAQGKPMAVTARWTNGSLQVRVPAATSSPVGSVEGRPSRSRIDGDTAYVVLDRQQTKVSWPIYDVDAVEEEDLGGAVKVPINGRVAKVFVEKGAKVVKGDRIAVVEAMKMEYVLSAPSSGIVSELSAVEGTQVRDGQILARIG